MYLIQQIQMKNVMKETRSACQVMNALMAHVQETVSTAFATFYQQHYLYYQFNYRNRQSITVVSFGAFESEMLLLSSTSHHPTQHGRSWEWKSNWSFVLVFKCSIKFLKFYFCSTIKINIRSSACLHFELSFCWDAHFSLLWVQHFLYHSVRLSHCTLHYFHWHMMQFWNTLWLFSVNWSVSPASSCQYVQDNDMHKSWNRSCDGSDYKPVQCKGNKATGRYL